MNSTHRTATDCGPGAAGAYPIEIVCEIGIGTDSFNGGEKLAATEDVPMAVCDQITVAWFDTTQVRLRRTSKLRVLTRILTRVPPYCNDLAA
ncbi:hypothetical protein MUP07_09145 [Candidatus Bathyarchaeota archaeon]|nr:hypothetical protein [Candidatus Bathyarchaeota archaeon]